ncbi:MAG: methyl-accepting chemotaxis protein [Oscillospiraceae bacterium]|jgi:methyl-accepting chemotaxis protein|nr:methyl-accepting chemotaxis protein [Oscillospiraceae bacterium]
MKTEEKTAAGTAAIPTAYKRGITQKLVGAIVVTIVVMVAALLSTVYFRISGVLLSQSQHLLQETTGKAVQETAAWMNRTLTMLEMQRDTVQYRNMDVPEMKEYIQHTVGQNSAYPAGLYVALTDGSLYHASFVPGPDFVASEKSWYKDGIKSEDFILGDVYFDEDSRSYVVGASGVLRDAAGEIRGVAAADVYLDSISQIVSNIQIQETGGIFLVDTRTDTIIGHRDPAMTGRTLGEFSGDMYAYAAQRIKSGALGLSLYEDGGMYIQTAAIPSSDWIAVAYVSKGEVLSSLQTLTGIMASVSVMAVLVAVLLTILLVRRIIGRPVAELSRVAAKIADGELDQTISYSSNDELGELAGNFGRTVVRLREYIDYIDEISQKLQEISQGDLSVSLSHEYTGEFSKIKASMEQIAKFLNSTIGQIDAAAKDMADGAKYVAEGAQNLSLGSSQQTDAVNMLSDRINEVSDGIQKTAMGAQKAKEISGAVGNSILGCNEKMQQMSVAIEKISDKSKEIHTIIKTIEDIAFQTNILALNAAVEAARAGTAGKGFAVVADEVRSLASRSAEAAKSTTDLIAQTAEAVEEGTTVAEATAASMLAVVDREKEVNNLIVQIAEYSGKQAEAAEEVINGIGQISQVVQSNLSTAEKSASASEELSGQAGVLKNLVAKFRLRTRE